MIPGFHSIDDEILGYISRNLNYLLFKEHPVNKIIYSPWMRKSSASNVVFHFNTLVNIRYWLYILGRSLNILADGCPLELYSLA